MTLLMLNTRIGKFALAAVAVAVFLIGFDAPAVTEAAGGAQTAGASENAIFGFLLGLFALIFGASAIAGGIAGALM